MRRSLLLAAALVIGAGAVTATSSPVAAATVPAGFEDVAVASVSRPTGVEWLPDGRIAVLQQGGRLLTGFPGEALAGADIPGICSNSERGLLGLAPHPAYASNGQVFVYSTRNAGGTCVNRVSRFTLRDGVIDPATEVVLVDNISSVNGNHNGGDLDVGSDGLLYVAVGDAGRDPRLDSGSAGGNDAAQDLSLLNGKVLRLTLDGAPAPGNPFSGAGTVRCGSRGNTPSTPTTTCQEIFSWGLRNPYRFAFDRNDGSDRFFVNDVGQNTMEEVSEGGAGNFGWPTREGNCPQGDTPPCAGPAPGLIDPITSYTRSVGTFITGGAFVPDGRWPAAYDGGYLFADGGSGEMWFMASDGSVDYDNPFATGLFGITDLTFGYDATGRTVLYYVTVSGSLGMIRPTSAPVASLPTDAKLLPVDPFRAYDTSRTGETGAVGTEAGVVVAGTSRRIDLDPPAGVEAALVNITAAGAAGPGFVSTWATGDRPDTSSLNVDTTRGIVANTTIIPLASDGSFLLDASLSGRVIVDVMAWVDDTGGTSTDGRFVAADPARLIDTRLAAGTTLSSGSSNPYTRSGSAPTVDLTVETAGESAVPDDGTADAVVLSVTAISQSGAPGYVGAYPTGTTYDGTSNVNVLPGEIRANLAIVPLGTGGQISLRTFEVGAVAVDVLGYVTSSSATSSGTGLYTGVDTTRLIDTRVPIGPLSRLTDGVSATVSVPGGASASAVVHNVAAVRTGGRGFLTLHPDATVPEVSTLNYTAAGQVRSALAFTPLAGDGSFRITPEADTDVLVDLLGTFSN